MESLLMALMSEATTDPDLGPGPSGPEKWGEAGQAGYQPVPDVLLAKQKELELDQTDMIVLLNLTSYWWYKNRPPYPRTNLIASRMGVSSRTVQRSIKKLEKKGYIRRDGYTDESGITTPAVYLDGLVEKLGELARHDSMFALRLARFARPKEFSEEGEIPF